MGGSTTPSLFRALSKTCDGRTMDNNTSSESVVAFMKGYNQSFIKHFPTPCSLSDFS